MPLFLLFVLIPLVEIGLFITVGGWIGLWPTLAIVVLTAVVGAWLVRREGLRALDDLRRAMNQLSDPATPLAHGAMILFAGALLITPGFFTDTVGFLLLIPPVRSGLIAWLKARVTVARFTYGTDAGPRTPNKVIDGEFEEVGPKRGGDAQSTGSNRH